MARVTVEDCIVKVPNRFDLVMLAAQRAREIAAGSELTVERDNDKNPVVALREIAEDPVDGEELKESIILGLQKHVEMDDVDEDELEDGAVLLAEDGGIGIAESEAAPDKPDEGDDDAAPAATYQDEDVADED